MRLTPAQIAVHLICGQAPLPLQHHYESLEDQLREGRMALVKLTGRDFGYDLLAWHDHLKESREGGYTWSRAITMPRIMKAALADVQWQKAASSLSRSEQER